MEITLEAVEKVMELTGVDYAAAKDALVKADGDVDEAVKLIAPDEKSNDKVKETVEKIKAKVKEGNVDKVRISKDGEIVLSRRLDRRDRIKLLYKKTERAEGITTVVPFLL